MEHFRETFTPAETTVLNRFFTNVDRPVFGLINLPEVVKGALFARYSRSPKSVRRLFLDEFMENPETGIETIAAQLDDDDPLINLRRAEQLYDRVFFEYGDDSVAQLGGVHLAVEQASNVLTKILEWGRLASYLEQSTRYIYYDARLGDRYRYQVPPEIAGSPLSAEYTDYMDGLFDTYSTVVAIMTEFFAERFPKQGGDSSFVWKSTIRAKACDTARGLLPAATLSNVGIYGTGQAYEMALLRMQAHPLAEVRQYGDMMLEELRKTIPSFLRRVDLPDRGVLASRYQARIAQEMREIAAEMVAEPEPSAAVTLTDWDPDAETKLVAAALYSVTDLPDVQLTGIAGRLSGEERARIIAAYVGDRGNRRHKPGRAMERSAYRFDMLCDYGAFRDLQRHRMLTLEWQPLSARLGHDTPVELAEVEPPLVAVWQETMERAGAFYETARETLGIDVAQYVVPFAFNVRFVMQMNAREAVHLIELRTQPAGHRGYRLVCQEMHRQIREVAGHHNIADAMRFVDYSDPDLERLESERRAEKRRGTWY
ncbi:MAG: FAD-dependent thymidylate synthase [Acidimicrobiia bacterium]|nr:FAD-dependent thymidylate synthase [Acidimicrobiia bacterium]MDH3396468.1 FAD-dependent thymidylate synthase [Acidimicrobiia bacterium]